MTVQTKEQLLKILLVVIGVTFIFGIWVLGQVWPSGWLWHEGGRSHYHEMIMAVYAVLGVFLVLAARNPKEHLSLIWFTVWSSVAHGLVMAVQSFQYSQHLGHLWGDVLALFLVAAAMAYFAPRKSA